MFRTARVLIVDDSAMMRRVTRQRLHELGCSELVEADGGDAAWALLQAWPFDFVVTDWEMPGLSGIQLLHRIRADARLARLPVVVVTARAGREGLAEAIRAGASGYLPKPYSAGALGERIRRFLRGGVAAP